ncbi:MAG: hypothetical protein LBE09_07490 [Christensenellaceae bacterium]|nr:hypothetical protein [Christensenellaceae bacterium]
MPETLRVMRAVYSGIKVFMPSCTIIPVAQGYGKACCALDYLNYLCLIKAFAIF